jgi:hypothetical protein
VTCKVAPATGRFQPRALSDPNWRTARLALDDLMRKLLVVHRLLEAEERLPKREPRRNG